MAALIRKNNQLYKVFLAIRQVSSNSRAFKKLEFVTHKQPVKRACALNTLRGFATVAPNFENNYVQSKLPESTLENGFVDNLLFRLDTEAKQFGQINKREVFQLLQHIRKTGQASSIQGLYLLHFCGSLLSFEIPYYRNKLVHEIWDTLQNLGVPLDVSHYNALLNAYLENNYSFTPSEFLASMENNGVAPNRVTFQRIIEKYCLDGDLTGASAVLEHMKEKEMVISEQIFNSLILGHARAKDMDGVKNLLQVMREKFQLGLSADTYTAIACGYAENGNIEEYRKTLKEAEENNQFLSMNNYFQLLFSVATAGDVQCMNEILNNIDPVRSKSQCLNVATMLTDKGLDEVAYKILSLVSTRSFKLPSANFIKALIMKDKPIETIVKYCEDIFNSGLHDNIYSDAAKDALVLSKIDYALKIFELMKEKGMELRPHFFWPVFVQCGKKKIDQDIWAVLSTMSEMGVAADVDTYMIYILPGIATDDSAEIIAKVKETGQSESCFIDSLFLHYLTHNHKLATDMLAKYDMQPNVNIAISFILKRFREDVDSVLQILQNFNSPQTGLELNSIFALFLDRLIERFPSETALIERYLREYHSQMIYIPENWKRALVDKLNLLAPELVALLVQSNRETSGLSVNAQTHPRNKNIEELEESLKRANETGENARAIMRHLLSLYCKNKQPDGVFKMKAELDKLDYTYSPASYAMLFNHFVQFDNLDEAYNVKKSCEEQYHSFKFDAAKLIDFSTLLVKSDRIDEAMKVIETDLANCVMLGSTDFLINSVSKLLNVACDKDDAELTRKLFDRIVCDLKLINPTNRVLSPLVNLHLKSGDYDAAIAEYENCAQRYKCFPSKYELFNTFITGKDPERLQKVVDISNSRNSRGRALHELAYAFVENGCIQEARRVMLTLGMRADMQTLSFICERACKLKRVTELEQFISVTKDLSHIDRGQLYNFLLDVYDQDNNYQAALEMWNTMQEECVKPSSYTLTRLAELLNRNNQDVPFVSSFVPWTSASNDLFSWLEQKNEIEVLETLKKMKKGEIHSLKTRDFTVIIDLLVERKCLKELLTNVQVMSCILSKPGEVMKPVLKKYAEAGDIKAVKELCNFLPEFAHKYVSCNSYYFEAYLVSGKAEELLSLLQEDVKSTRALFSSLKFVQLLAKHPELEAKAVQLTDEYDKEGFESPKIMLWLHYFLHENHEKADEIFKVKSKPILAKESHFVEIMKSVRLGNNETLGRKLVELANMSMRTNIRARAYSCLLDVLVYKSKLEEALELIEEAKKFDISLTQFLNASLLNLKRSLLEKNMTIPFEIPVEDPMFSSSSSSSDDESK